ARNRAGGVAVVLALAQCLVVDVQVGANQIGRQSDPEVVRLDISGDRRDQWNELATERLRASEVVRLADKNIDDIAEMARGGRRRYSVERDLQRPLGGIHPFEVTGDEAGAGFAESLHHKRYPARQPNIVLIGQEDD